MTLDRERHGCIGQSSDLDLNSVPYLTLAETTNIYEFKRYLRKLLVLEEYSDKELGKQS